MNNNKLISSLALLWLLLSSCSSKKSSEVFLNTLVGSNPYHAVDFKIGSEGVMGDLYRSWIIEMPEKSSDLSSAWNTWREARPALSKSDLIDILREHHPDFFEVFNSEKIQIDQRVVPEGMSGFRGLATVRVISIDGPKRYMFILLESC